MADLEMRIIWQDRAVVSVVMFLACDLGRIQLFPLSAQTFCG